MSYQYHAMSNFFNRDNVGLTGFAAFYRVSSLEERTHAQQLMDYQVRHAAALMCLLMSTCVWWLAQGLSSMHQGNFETLHLLWDYDSHLFTQVWCSQTGARQEETHENLQALVLAALCGRVQLGHLVSL